MWLKERELNAITTAATKRKEEEIGNHQITETFKFEAPEKTLTTAYAKEISSKKIYRMPWNKNIGYQYSWWTKSSAEFSCIRIGKEEWTLEETTKIIAESDLDRLKEVDIA